MPAGSYYFRVRAQNAAGTGPASNEVAITYSAPGAPTGLTVSRTSTALTLSWKAPTSGAIVTGYVLEGGTTSGAANLGSFTLAALSTALTSTVPSKGTYFLRIKAKSGAGTGAPTNEVKRVVP